MHCFYVLRRAIVSLAVVVCFTLTLNTTKVLAQAPTCGQEAADIVIMLDRTGSVSPSERTLEAGAANNLINLLGTLNNGQRVGIGVFASADNNNATIVTSLTTVTPANVATLQGNVNTALSSQHGGTNIASAISVAQAELVAHASTSHRVIILISDGQANLPTNIATGTAAAQTAATNAKNAGTRIITVAFDANGSTSTAVNGRTLLAEIATQPSADNTVGAVSDAERDAENADGDDFFIAPTSDSINSVFSQISNSITCNDNDPCTVDTCNNGNTCSSQRIEGCVACQSDANCDDHNPCTADSCGNDGTCHHDTLENGTACEDGNLCTNGSTCQSGSCQGGTEVTCEASDSCHNAGTCNPQTGTCSNPVKENGSACGDGDACNGSEVCQDGSCQAGTPVATDDSNPCTVDYCGEDGLAHHDNVADGTVCNDNGNACDGVSTCQSGSCVQTTAPVTCEASDSCHTAGTCDPQSGTCSNPAKENGSACGDGNACNGSESCQDGECTSGTAVNCDDQNPCTADSCQEDGSCAHTPIVGTEQCPAPSVCGNGVLERGEQCDLGELNHNGGDCESDCTLPTCGNGIVDSGEECDQGPVISEINAQLVSTNELVTCNNDCTLNRPQACGNGILEGTETCDDGNTADGDGCSANCSIEQSQAPVCGNEILETGEACDDGNTINGDGCSSTCTVETTVETPQPAITVPGGGFSPILEGQSTGCILNLGSVSNPSVYGLMIFALGSLSVLRRRSR